MSNIPRIGFACKYIDPRVNLSPKHRREAELPLNFRSTTVKHMRTLSESDQRAKLHDIVNHNLNALRKQIEYLGGLPKSLRMMRIGSDILPLYTHEDFLDLYTEEALVHTIRDHLARTGERARELDCRLSFHPGQFCILNSLQDHVVQNSVDEIEYHTDVARWMGYGGGWHPHGFVINIHTGGRAGGLDAFRRNFRLLSRDARNLLTVENDEISYGLDDMLDLGDTCPVVLDIHHEWVKTGEYIRPSDERWQRVVDSWRGVRPKIHYSASRQDLLEGHAQNLPDMAILLEQGYKKQKLRAHSDMCWNSAINQWALEFLPHSDIMVEAKNKNLASKQLYDQAVSADIIQP
jgi:UV damage endonuclease UvdE